jgi:hypothetical protein
MRLHRIALIAFFTLPRPAGSIGADPMLSVGRQPDPTAKTLAEIRAAERRRIPLEVQLKSADRYPAGGPVEVTIIVTNLFDAPLVMNSRMLVNHPLLQGEISFRIIGPNGKKIEIQRFITPLTLRDQDFVTLARGQSMQRAVDLADLYGVSRKGVYKLQVFYHNEVDHAGESQHAWKGMVWSEPVEVRLD